MKHQIYLLLIFILVSGIACSESGNNSAALPQVNNASSSAVASGSHSLWGMWQVVIDTTTSMVDITPVRSGQFHANVVNFMQPPFPVGMGIKIESMDLETGIFDIAVSLTHPFNDPTLVGFDVKGIFIASGTEISKYDDSLVYSNANEPRLLNADGHTRWWNPVEFPLSGLLGYKEGILGNKGVKFTNRLNPFKYFADHLQAKEDFNVEPGSRNHFSPASTNTRNYLLQFPLSGGNPVIVFNYAVDANWESPVGDPSNIDNFPAEANQEEAYKITVDDSLSTMYYHSASGKGGGTLDITIDVSDYGIGTSPAGVSGELSIVVIENPTLFDIPVVIDKDFIVDESDDTVTFHVVIPDVSPNSNDHEYILIHAVTVDDYYDQGYGTPAPNKKLAAYYVHQFSNISSVVPAPEAPSNVTADVIRSSSGKLTGFSLDWDDVDDADDYVVYWSTDPYQTSGAMNFVPASNGVVMDSSYGHMIASTEANGQWMLYVVARAVAGDNATKSAPSEKVFIDFCGFENIVENNGDKWKIRCQKQSTGVYYNRFQIYAAGAKGIDSSGALHLTPNYQFTHKSVTYCVSPAIPQIDNISECYFEFAHKRPEDFPLITGSYRYGYSVGSINVIEEPDKQFDEFDSIYVREDYNFDLVNGDIDYISGVQMNYSYIEGLHYRYVDPVIEIGDVSNGWSGTASDFLLSRYRIPAGISGVDKYLGICFGGREDVVSNPSVLLTEPVLICDEFALVIY